MLKHIRAPFTCNSFEEVQHGLREARVTLSPLPFCRIFDSFVSDPDVVLYRCIRGTFDPSFENADWSLNPQHALEYTASEGLLLITQMSKADLLRGLSFYSQQGNKLGLLFSPPPSLIAVCRIGPDSFFNPELLRCMRRVVTMGIDPSDTTESRAGHEIDRSKITFSASQWDWLFGVMAALDEPFRTVVPAEVAQDFALRREKAS